jgi:hypothetical protein
MFDETTFAYRHDGALQPAQKPLPIDTAPIRPDVFFEPCLFWDASPPACWTIGFWSGDAWCLDDGTILQPQPKFWAPLPEMPRP